MSFFKAVLLGLLQGITEFFPISSSGHLLVAEQFLGIETDYGILFNVILHIGTLAAILFAFQKDVRRLSLAAAGILVDICGNLQIFIKNLLKKQEIAYRKVLRTQYRRQFVLLLIASVPTAMIGIIMRNVVSRMTNSLVITGVGLLVTGLLLFVVGYIERGTKEIKTMSWLNALMIGACQGFSVVPGISRFGVTLSAGLLSGYSKAFAVRFSLLLSIPAIAGAVIWELIWASGEVISVTLGFVLCCLVGAIVSAATGYFVIKTMLRIVKKGKLRYFAYYCFGAGIVVLVMNYIM